MKSTQLEETDHGVVIEVYVKPNSKQFQVKAEDDRLVVFCKESPVKGRANKELTRELSSLFKRRVEIISGHRSKQKRILIRDSNAKEVRGILRAQTPLSV